ncbi:MAG: histidine kinase [Acidobacteria bacterium]|nr:histidine kinase [Acidobacteriota bacterium]
MSFLFLSIGVLLSATLLCGMAAILARGEPSTSPSSRILPWLLGLGTAWYLTMAGQYAIYPVLDELVKDHNRVIPAGLLRPALLLFLAGLAHCYVSELPPPTQRKIPIWLIYLPTLTILMILAGFRLTSQYYFRVAGPFRVESKPILLMVLGIVLFDLAIVMFCHWQLTKSARRSLIWLGIGGLEALLLYFSFHQWPRVLAESSSYYDLLSMLLPIPLTLWLAYNRARYQFFDVFIKNGAVVLAIGLAMGLSISAGIFYFQWFFPNAFFQERDVTPAALVQFCLGCTFLSVPLVTVVIRWRPRLDAWVDLVLLRRPGYAQAFKKLLPLLQQATDEASAIDRVCAHLTEVMQANRVEFVPDTTLEAGSTTDISQNFGGLPEMKSEVLTGDQYFGVLHVVGSSQGLRYLSEDVIYCDRVAGLLAGMLLTLRTQAERTRELHQAQQLRELANQAHIRALQAQINPHFLFNCLNLLNSLVRTDPERARALMQRLAAVFRYTLDSTRKETVTLAEELKFVEDYLEIARARFGNRLSTSIEIEANLHNTQVLPMLVQPLVENALHHGIEPKVGPARLDIRAFSENGSVVIEVADDGIGFAAKDLSQTGQANSKNPESHAGIALANINDRMKSQFGTTLTIQSQPHIGTKVELRFPGQV